MTDLGYKPCETQISELDLKALGLSNELITKASDFSLGKAIDKMEEFGWCPKSECGKVADICKEKGMGEC